MSTSMSGGRGYGSSGSGSRGSQTGSPSGYREISKPNFSPEQMDLFKSLFSDVGPESFLSKLGHGDEQAFGQIEKPALRQFNDISANIANRFSGAGMGGRKSSGFQNAQTSAAGNFAEKLQANRMGLQQQALKDLHSMSQGLLNQKPYEYGYEEEPEGFLSKLLGSLSPGIGMASGGGLGLSFLKKLFGG